VRLWLGTCITAGGLDGEHSALQLHSHCKLACKKEESTSVTCSAGLA